MPLSANSPFGPEPPGSDKRRADNLDCENGIMNISSGQRPSPRPTLAVPGSAARQQSQLRYKNEEVKHSPSPGYCQEYLHKISAPKPASESESDSEISLSESETSESSSDYQDHEPTVSESSQRSTENIHRRIVRRRKNEAKVIGKFNRARRAKNPAEVRYGHLVKFHYENEKSPRRNNRKYHQNVQIENPATSLDQGHGQGQDQPNCNECTIPILN